MSTFGDFTLNKQLYNAIDSQGWKTPTPIQEKAIPIALGGYDIIGIAQTGTGKTAAYLIPIIFQLKYAQGNTPRCLIVVPTKELAIQVEEQAKTLAENTDLRVLGIYGGIGITNQISEIEKGIDIIVSTPKRLFEAYKRGALIFKKLTHLVLDEADRLMEMGFLPQLHQTLEIIPTKRKNYLFSATFNERVSKISEDFLENPKIIKITPSVTTATTVQQFVYAIPNFRTKVELLKSLLEDATTYRKVIVFTKTKEMATNLFKFIDRSIEGGVAVLHSNKSQNSRINAISKFKNGDIRCIVSTDVSSRGIDVENVSHVINFELPKSTDDYVHRIGRTGRANNNGIAITFANKSELLFLNDFTEKLDISIEQLNISDNIKVYKTEKKEIIDIEREVDRYKKLKNPDYKGAFHEKKRNLEKTKKGKFRGTNKKKK